MLLRLGLAPALTLQKRISRGALFTGLMIYLEGIATLALLTEKVLSPIALVPIIFVMSAQYVVVRRPVRLLVRDRLNRSYRYFFFLALVFVVVVGFGSRSGDDRIAAAVLAALVIALTSWPVIAAMRTARDYRAELRSLDDPDVLMSCLSFDIGNRIAARLRSFGGHRARWAAPFVSAAVALVASLVALALLQRALGLNFGALIGQASALVAMWVLYRSMRHAKPRASELRERDRRPPILILREFQDDALMTQGFSFGRSFEHYFAQELDRIGPTISVGRPGEALAPLGAARDYLADPDWKRRVADLIHDAAVVVFLLGDSESLLWEFRTTVAMRGKQRMLMMVPPLRDRAELARRWTRFVGATTDVIGPELPRELPDEPLLAFFFAGDDAVLMAGAERTRSRRLFPKAPLDYRLALRLFGCLLREDPRSARAVEGFMLRNLPVVASSLVP